MNQPIGYVRYDDLLARLTMLARSGGDIETLDKLAYGVSLEVGQAFREQVMMHQGSVRVERPGLYLEGGK